STDGRKIMKAAVFCCLERGSVVNNTSVVYSYHSGANERCGFNGGYRMRHRIVLAVLALCLFVPMVVAGGSQRPKPKPAQPPATKEDNKTAPTTAAKPAAPQSARKAPVADNQWALLVGVSQYPGQIQSLGF